MTKNPKYNYYNQNARAFIEGSLSADMTQHYKRFLDHVPQGGSILDAGCGSGRDALYFKQRGYQVSAFDGSIEMVNFATGHTQLAVQYATFEDIELEVQSLDGIWANASLLHLEPQVLQSVCVKLLQALKPCGVFYASFKYGSGCQNHHDRTFYHQTQATFEQLLQEIALQVPVGQVDYYVTDDVRPNRVGEQWLNVLIYR